MKTKGNTLVIVHAGNDIAAYERETLAKLTHTSGNDFRSMKNSQKLAKKKYTSLKDLLNDISETSSAPYAIWIRNEEVWEEMDSESLKALDVFYTEHFIPVGILGEGAQLKAHLQKITGAEVSVDSNTGADPNNIVFFSRYSPSGRHRELYLEYEDPASKENNALSGKEKETAYHFPFNSDSENALGKLAWDEMSPIQQGHFPNPNTFASEATGDPDLGRGPWLTYGNSVQYYWSNADVSARIWIDPYRLNDNNSKLDYYLFMINYSQGINNYKQTCDTVGFYGQYMNLDIYCNTLNSKIYDYGPNTTVNQATVGFTIGGGLHGGVADGKPEAGGSFDASFSVSFSIPEVNITTIPRFVEYGSSSLKWEFTLPKVGWVSPGVPANPGGAAKGFMSYPCFIMQVPSGNDPEFTITPDIRWVQDHTRGIEHKKFEWKTGKKFKFSKLPPTPPKTK